MVFKYHKKQIINVMNFFLTFYIIFTFCAGSGLHVACTSKSPLSAGKGGRSRLANQRINDLYRNCANLFGSTQSMK